MYVFPLLAAAPTHHRHQQTHHQYQQQQQQQALPVPTNPSTLGELMSFFPFDPYKLSRSSSYIEPIYREWTSVAVGVDDDEDEEEEEGEEEVDEEVDVRKEADGLGASFEEMRISPVPAPLAPLHGAAVALGISSIVG
jgi:hypothetical protein